MNTLNIHYHTDIVKKKKSVLASSVQEFIQHLQTFITDVWGTCVSSAIFSSINISLQEYMIRCVFTWYVAQNLCYICIFLDHLCRIYCICSVRLFISCVMV